MRPHSDMTGGLEKRAGWHDRERRRNVQDPSSLYGITTRDSARMSPPAESASGGRAALEAPRGGNVDMSDFPATARGGAGRSEPVLLGGRRLDASAGIATPGIRAAAYGTEIALRPLDIAKEKRADLEPIVWSRSRRSGGTRCPSSPRAPRTESSFGA